MDPFQTPSCEQCVFANERTAPPNPRFVQDLDLSRAMLANYKAYESFLNMRAKRCGWCPRPPPPTPLLALRFEAVHACFESISPPSLLASGRIVDKHAGMYSRNLQSLVPSLELNPFTDFASAGKAAFASCVLCKSAHAALNS